MLNLPDTLVHNNVELRGEAGREWLERLPELIAACERRWSLTAGPPLLGLSYNYAAAVLRADGTPAILKIGFPGDHELCTEIEALRLIDGRGAVRLLEADPEQGALLLERLEPGTSLEDLPDEQATSIAAAVMRRLWRPAPAEHGFPSVAEWVERMAARAPRVLERDGSFPAAWLERAVTMSRELSAPAPEPVLLHGDLHHGNVLAAKREPWLAIDPKGVVGEPAAEPGAFLLNPMSRMPNAPDAARTVARRVPQLAEELGIDRERLVAWSTVRAVLSAFWSLEDHGHGWQWAIRCAEILDGLAG
jgi:streptomycin 6-kinase